MKADRADSRIFAKNQEYLIEHIETHKKPEELLFLDHEHEPLRVGPPKPHAHDKGDKGGSCNREACQRPGAYWYNHGTQRYYCDTCAHWLNTDTFNRRDAARLYGHDLCTYQGPGRT